SSCVSTKQASGSSHLTQQLKFTTPQSRHHIKDEFQLLQAQYHSLKLKCDKQASEKLETLSHYVMSTTNWHFPWALAVHPLQGLNHVRPYIPQEQRAKKGAAPELNPISRQQLQAHQLSQLRTLAQPLTPLPGRLQPPSLLAASADTGLLSLSVLGSSAHLSKEYKNGHDSDTHQEDDGEKLD
uniref:Groucho/TLE N-terminal Q-rich domain-containing protein n=1 Tax=Phocoena sinus TaxID=42100 RepID=A0A8C9CWA6_PHOSS